MEDAVPPASDLLKELLGKKVLIKTYGGMGIKDVVLIEGDYTGNLIGFDHKFVKLEYTIRTYPNGVATDTKDVVLISLAYIITVGEYREREQEFV